MQSQRRRRQHAATDTQAQSHIDKDAKSEMQMQTRMHTVADVEKHTKRCRRIDADADTFSVDIIRVNVSKNNVFR